MDLPHITALAFLPLAAASSAGIATATQELPPLRVLAGTAQHKLYLYDLSVGKRPQMDLSWGETKITALAPEPGGGCCAHNLQLPDNTVFTRRGTLL